MSNSNSSKQILLITIVISVMIIAVVGVAFAFFNYTRTGSENTIRVGRMAFVSRQTNTISLTDLFPIDPTVPGIMNDDTKVGTLEIEIEGDTDYSGGIEYLVSSVDSNITTSTGKTVPISLSVSVDGLGTSNANYFTARENTNASIYKKIVGDTLAGDQMLLVGFITPNATSGSAEGVNGSITIKAYLDENKILISDTYDGTESDNMGTPNSMAQGRVVLTTAEWNALQVAGASFKIKVEANEGIWVNNTLDNIIRTKNLNTITNRPIMDNEQSEFVSESTGVDFGAVSGDTNGKGIYMRAGTENDAYPIVYYRGAVEDNNVIFNNKCWKAVRTTDTGGVKLIYNGTTVNTNVYNNIALESNQYNLLTNTAGFVFDNMDNTYTASIVENGAYNFEFSFSVTTEGEYTLYATKNNSPGSGGVTLYKNDDMLLASGFSPDIEQNISQNYETISTNDRVRVVFNGGGFSESNPGILKIKIVKKITSSQPSCNNTGLDTMINISGTNRFAFSGTNLNNLPTYVGYMWGESMNDMEANINPSNAKTQIDAWYLSNMNTVTSKLEDTIWCNDRSVENGGDLSTYLFYGAYQRSALAPSSSTVKNQPSLTCANKNDAFTVNNGNGNQKLTYPVALLTEDEMVLAGGRAASTSGFYLNNGSAYWSMSPYSFNESNANEFVLTNGSLDYSDVSDPLDTFGLRPAISIKPGLPVVSGTGTVNDPYVIE